MVGATLHFMPSDDDALNPRWFDWLARTMAWSTMKLPRIAPSRWSQENARLSAGDLESHTFEITAKDGAKLDGWYFPGSQRSEEQNQRSEVGGQRSGNAEANAAAVPIVFSHGWTETKEFHLRLVRVLTAAGHPVIIYDQRGHGRSQGTCSLGVLEPSDLRCALDHASERGWICDRVINMGVSMGGASVLIHAATDPRVIGVVSYAPFTSFLDAIRSYGRRYFPFLSASWGVRGFIQSCHKQGFDIAQASALEAVKKITVPMLLIVGQRDINLPATDHSRVLLEHAAPGLASLIEVPDATHFNICMKRWPGVDEQVLSFIESCECPSIR